MSTNLFAQFSRLLPKAPLRVGTVLSIGDGSVLVEEYGGAAVSVRGTATIGDRVYFRDGAVEGPAPFLPIELVEE